MAFHLGMTVKEVMALEYTEFQGWMAYFEMFPPGWQEDSRTFTLMQLQGYTGQGSSVFESLAKKAIADEKRRSKMNATSNLKNSIFFQHMLTAKGGDKLEL